MPYPPSALATTATADSRKGIVDFERLRDKFDETHNEIKVL
jgi:hypothetical protein